MTSAESNRDPVLGFGVVAGLSEDLLATLAQHVERLGYGSFWINDGGTREADGLAGLAVVAAAAPSLALGVGVLPLDRRAPADMAASVTSLRLPLDRLRLGLGSGASAQPLGLVSNGVAQLRDILPDARIFISALGPRMSRLAGAVADGVLFNWAVPARLSEIARMVAEGEREAGRGPIERWTYVRAAIGDDSRERLADEARRYARTPAYGRAFAAMGAPFDDVGVVGNDLSTLLAPYRDAVDGVVVRALPREWTIDEALAIAVAAAPGLPAG